jgi:hypothetical protein
MRMSWPVKPICFEWRASGYFDLAAFLLAFLGEASFVVLPVFFPLAFLTIIFLAEVMVAETAFVARLMAFLIGGSATDRIVDTAFSIGRFPSAEALPTNAPATPPAMAPTGPPTMPPRAAPAIPPAVCFETAGRFASSALEDFRIEAELELGRFGDDLCFLAMTIPPKSVKPVVASLSHRVAVESYPSTLAEIRSADTCEDLPSHRQLAQSHSACRSWGPYHLAIIIRGFEILSMRC